MKASFSEEFTGTVIAEDTGDSLTSWHLFKLDKYQIIWMKSVANKLGRLAQGISNIPGMDTIGFIPRSDVPSSKSVTYSRILCMCRL
jgi:hypothetical protein